MSQVHRGKPVPPDTPVQQLPWRPIQTPAKQWLNASNLPHPQYDDGMRSAFLVRQVTQYLEENKSAVEDIFERIQGFGTSFLSETMMDVNRAFGRVARATYTTLPWQSGDKSVASELKRILEKAAEEIEELSRKKPA